MEARFFSWLHDTPYYQEVHAQAVKAVEPGRGRRWMDVGCGPGLVGLAARFAVGALGALPAQRAAVVSAASLVCVLPGLDLLWQHPEPAGCLLVIETTAQMTLEAAWRKTPRALPALLWGLARRGRTVAGVIDTWQPNDEAERSVFPLADGTVAAWRITRSTHSEQP